MKRTKIIGLVLAVAVIALYFIVPTPAGLEQNGFAAICVMGSLLILLLTDAFPIAISCLIAPCLMILLKAVGSPGEAFSGFTNHIIYFIIASFGISLALSSTNISKRLLVALTKIFGTSVNRILLAIMVCTAVLSSILSNVAATVIFLTVVMDFLKVYSDEEERKKSGKSFMIGLPIASMIGGMITPAGSSLNLLILDYLKKDTLNIFGREYTVSFVQWMVCSIPIVIVLIPLAWWIITKINKPVEVEKEKLDQFITDITVKEPLNFKEKYVLVIVAAMIICWVLSSWFPVFNITVVAVLGVALFFVPGIEVLKWKDYEKEISWSAIILLGSVISIGNALVNTGASAWLVGQILPQTVNMHPALLAFLVSIFIFAMLIFIPVAPALISVLSYPLISLAYASSVGPILLMMTMAFTVCNCFLLPFDTVPVITYMTGYYTKGDLAKTAVWIQIGIAALIALWLPIALKILNLM